MGGGRGRGKEGGMKRWEVGEEGGRRRDKSRTCSS